VRKVPSWYANSSSPGCRDRLLGARRGGWRPCRWRSADPARIIRSDRLFPRAERRAQDHAEGMTTDRDEFLAWVRSALYETEVALHNGDAAPRRALWSRTEPGRVAERVRAAGGG
jgi:hypothetical protein